MANLVDFVSDTEPQSGALGFPLRGNPYFLLIGSGFDTTSLEEGLFLEGPEYTHQVGPGGYAHEYNPATGDISLIDTPGYLGTVPGTVTVSTVSGNTRVLFDPELPLAALVDYKLVLSDVLELDGTTEISGIITLSFTSGSGAIEEIPSEVSTSVLANTSQAVSAGVAVGPFLVEKTTPADHSVQQDIALEEIEIEFNKAIDSDSVSADNIQVQTIPATDHPATSITALGNLTKTVEVSGKKIIIKI